MGSVHRIDRPKPWLAKYRGPDGRQHSRSFHRKVDAERWIRDEESKIDRAAWVDPRGGAIPFADYAETWLDSLHELKPKTVNEYRWHLTSRVLPTFGDKRLRSINPATVREWHRRWAATRAFAIARGESLYGDTSAADGSPRKGCP